MGDQDQSSVGVVRRWIVPLAFIVLVVGLFWFLARMSLAVLGPESEMPDDHFAGACGACHRSEADFDPMDLVQQ